MSEKRFRNRIEGKGKKEVAPRKKPHEWKGAEYDPENLSKCPVCEEMTLVNVKYKTTEISDSLKVPVKQSYDSCTNPDCQYHHQYSNAY